MAPQSQRRCARSHARHNHPKPWTETVQGTSCSGIQTVEDRGVQARCQELVEPVKCKVTLTESVPVDKCVKQSGDAA